MQKSKKIKPDGILFSSEIRKFLKKRNKDKNIIENNFFDKLDIFMHAIINEFTPGPYFFQTFKAKKIIIGSNPLLTLLTLLEYSKSKESIIICPIDYNDNWGYDILEEKIYRRLIEKLIEKKYPYIDISNLKTNNHISEWIYEFSRIINNIIRQQANEDIYYIKGSYEYTLDKLKESDLRRVLFKNQKEKNKIHPIASSLNYQLLKILEANGREIKFTSVKDDKFHSHMIFAPEIVQTSTIPGGFAPEEDKQIIRLGSANEKAETHGEMFKRAIKDILTLPKKN